jgi:hypothetical protein
MPNWVPQSPMWFCRMTVPPRKPRIRASASPMMVERRCPTCISLATFGPEYSTTVRTPRSGVPVPSRGWACRRSAWASSAASVTVTLRKPGPAAAQPAMTSSGRTSAATAVASCRGSRPVRRASASSPSAWKSACPDRRTCGSNPSTSGSARRVAAMIRSATIEARVSTADPCRTVGRGAERDHVGGPGRVGRSNLGLAGRPPAEGIKPDRPGWAGSRPTPHGGRSGGEREAAGVRR